MDRIGSTVLVGAVVALFASACPKEREDAAASGVDVDECRYTVVKPDHQELRVWDGRFLDDETAPCFGRSLCFAGGEHTRVYRSTPGLLAIEVRERRFERPVRRARIDRVPHHRGLYHALVGDDGVALVLERELELLSAGGAARFPLPALEPGEAYGDPVLVDDGVAITLVEDQQAGLPVRPLLWLREPSGKSAGAAAGDAAGWPLVRDGKIVARLERVSEGWRVTSLERSFSAVVFPPSAVPPGSWVGEREILARHGQSVRVVGYDGAVFSLALSPTDVLVEADDVHYRVSLERGVERLSPSGMEAVIPRRPGHDLAGNRLPEGAVVERLQPSGDEAPRVAVVERVRLPGCLVEDRLHVVDVAEGRVTTLASDGRLRLHPRFARGKLHVVEADAVYEVVAGM